VSLCRSGNVIAFVTDRQFTGTRNYRGNMNTTTLIIIIVVLLVLGGGWGYSRRGRL
jgi:hypothetical protein